MTSNIYKSVVAHFGNQQKTASALKIKQSSVNAWIKGKAIMSERTALRVQKLTNSEFKALDLSPSLKEDFAVINVA